MAPDKPITPYINCLENKPIPLQLGFLGKFFVVAVLGLFVTVALNSYRVSAVEEDDATLVAADAQLAKDIKTLDKGLHQVDENQRIQASQTGLIVKQLNALLQKQGVTEHISAPDVEPSELEDLE